MGQRKIIRSLVLLLLVGFLTPIQSAVPAETITKTFTVRGANDVLLAGALVSVEYFDENVGANVRPPAVTTNSSGVATVNITKGVSNLSYVVFPGTNDTINAPISAFGVSSSSDENFNVKLEAANIVVNIQSSTGGPAPLGSVVTFPVGDGGQINYVRPIRSGAFGIRLSTNLNPASSYQIGLLQYVSEWTPGQFSIRYGLKAEGTAGALTYKVYTNTTYTTLLDPVNNVYVLKYDGFNVKGTLKTSTGSAFILPAGTTANVSIRPASGAFAFDASSGHPINATGQQLEWFGRLRGAAGKYVAAFSFNGSSTVPTFFTNIWKNSAGGFATSENGTYTTDPHDLEIRFPAGASNFAMKYYEVGTTTPVGYSYWLEEVKTENNNTQYNFLFSGNGGNTSDLVMNLPNGTYKLNLQTYEGVLNSYMLTVSGGDSVLKNAANLIVTKPSDGIYLLSPTPPNVRIRAINPSSTVINNACVEILNGVDGKGGSVYYRCTGNSTADFALPDGDYMARVNGGNEWMNYKDTTFVVNVRSGVATSPTVTKANDIFSASLLAKNFKFTLLAPNDDTPVLGWVNYCEYNSVTKREFNCGGDGVNQNGEGGSYLAPGKTYIITYNLPGTSSFTPSKYTAVVDANGVVTLTPSVTVTNSRHILRPATANVTGTIKVNGSAINIGNNQGVALNVQRKDEFGNWVWSNLSSFRNSATYGFNFTEEGEYRILANPQGFPDYAWSFSSIFHVFKDSNNALKFSTESKTDAGAKSSFTGNDSLDIVIRASNVKLRIIDNRSNEPMKYGWAAIFKKETNRETWIMNADLNSNNPGVAGAYLENGDYRVELNPFYNGNSIAGLTRKNYELNVNNATVSLAFKGTPILAGNDDRFTVWPSTANITARITDKQGTPLAPGENQWVSINIQKLNTSNGRWDWTSNWSNTDKDGFISMVVDTAGSYRLRVEPNGFTSSTVTVSEPFVVEAGKEGTFSKAFGDIKTISPSMRAKMVLKDSTTPIIHASIEVRKNNEWIDWVGTGPLGIANIAFAEEGTYQLVVHPRQEQLALGATRQSYEVVAAKNTAGDIVGSIASLQATDSIYSLALGSGNVQGTVYAPGGTTTTIANANVVAINTETNQEMWEFSASTSSTGKFSMNLPVGTYKIVARTPWGNADHGNGDPLGVLTVTASGVATSDLLTGMDPKNLTLNLKAPTWKGTVKNPSNAIVPFANVCLYDRDIWNCTTANENGEWALSAAPNFTSFSTNAFFEISDVRNRAYPNIRKSGPTDVANFIGLGGSNSVNGVTSLTLVHQFVNANFKVTITAGGVPRANVWVSIDRQGEGWLGGNSTDVNGVASFNITNISAGLNVRAEFNGNQELSGAYAPTFREFTTEEVRNGTSNSIVSLTLPLAVPNFVGKVTESSSSSTPARWSWVELIDDATDRWKSGSNTDDVGNFAMSIARPTSGDPLSYTLIVNPPWNATGNTSRKLYTLRINTAGEITLSDKNSGAAVGTITSNGRTYYPLTLGTPTVTGLVVSGSGNTEVGLRDSWVVPISNATGEWLWQQGVHSKTNGAFGLSLADGTYKIQAEVPWNVPNLTRSAQCSVSVSGGAVITAAGGCVQSNGSIKLALREPNLKLRLVQNGVAVPNAHVGIGVGGWYTGAWSNAQGDISLFVDRAAILAANPDIVGNTTRDIRVWVDPPFGNSSMVRWECNSGDNKPICSRLSDFNSTSDYAAVNLESVTVLGPNLKFKVNLPDNTTPAPAGSWVALLTFVPNGPCCNWIGGANTDSSGYVSFNVDTSTVAVNARFKVEVNPRWEDRTTYSRAEYDNSGNGFTFEELDQVNRAFALLNPNVLVEVRASDSTGNKWGWIGIEELRRSDNAWLKWIGGFGVDNVGKTAITLAADKRYRIVAYPGGGKSGTRTTCVVDTESTTALTIVAGQCGSAGTGVVSSNSLGTNRGLTLTLNAGNVVGTVTASGVAVAGAIVYANTVGATTQDNAVTTSTNSSGGFGLMLDPAKGQWQISIFPVNKPGGAQLPVKILNPITAPSLSGFLDLLEIRVGS